MYILTISKIQFIIINILIIYIFALIYKKYGNSEHFYFTNKVHPEPKLNKLNMTNALYFSLNTYSTIGNNTISPKTDFIKKIIMLEIFCLIFMIILLGCSNIEILQK